MKDESIYVQQELLVVVLALALDTCALMVSGVPDAMGVCNIRTDWEILINAILLPQRILEIVLNLPLILTNILDLNSSCRVFAEMSAPIVEYTLEFREQMIAIVPAIAPIV